MSLCDPEWCDRCNASKASSGMPHAFEPQFVQFTNSLHCSLYIHINFVSLNSSDLALHVFLTPSSHLVQGLHLSLLPSTSEGTWSFGCVKHMCTYDPKRNIYVNTYMPCLADLSQTWALRVQQTSLSLRCVFYDARNCLI